MGPGDRHGAGEKEDGGLVGGFLRVKAQKGEHKPKGCHWVLREFMNWPGLGG